jgi:hypothetical protein
VCGCVCPFSRGLYGSPIHPIESDFSRVRRRAMWRHTRPVVSGAPTNAMRRIAARCSPEAIFIVRDQSTRSNSSTASSRARGPVHRGTNCVRLTPAVTRGGRRTQKVSQLGPWTRSEILEERRRCSRQDLHPRSAHRTNIWRDALHARARARLRQPSPLRAGLQGRGRSAACVPYPIVTAAARPWPAVSSGNAGGSCGLPGGPFDSPWRRAISRPR